MRRLQLHLWRPAGHRDEPKAVIVRAWMTDLQLLNLNSGHLRRQSLDDVVNVSTHTSMPNTEIERLDCRSLPHNFAAFSFAMR